MVFLKLTSDVHTLVEIWMGDVDVNSAVKSNNLMLTGSPRLIRTARNWFPRSRMADIRPEKFMKNQGDETQTIT